MSCSVVRFKFRETDRWPQECREVARKPRKNRSTFRHGNLPAALIAAAIGRLRTGGAESLSLRELARDGGVNHRAVYRHFPDKLSLLAAVAREGWLRLMKEMMRQKGERKRGEAALVASAVGFFRFASAHPNLFHLMAGPRINRQQAFPQFEEAVTGAMRVFLEGFWEINTPRKHAHTRTLLFVAALTGVVEQILHRRIRVRPQETEALVAEAAKRLLSGLR